MGRLRPCSMARSAESGVPTVLDEQRRVRVEAQVTVVNAGPEPFNVLAVRVDQPGVTVRSPEKERQLEPGTASPVDVVVEWNCVRQRGDGGRERVRKLSPVALDGTPWIESRRAGCAGLG